MTSRRASIKQNLNWYEAFVEGITSSQLKEILEGLIITFERKNLQKITDRTILPVVKSLFKYCFYRFDSRLNLYTEASYYFWPIQLHHCYFMIPVINRLKSAGYKVEVFSYRKDIKQLLEKNDIKPCYIDIHSRIDMSHRVLIAFYEVLTILLHLVFAKGSLIAKGCFWNSLVDLVTVKKVKESASSILNQLSAGYHFIGYDLSLWGKTIIGELNQRGLPSGRIQNGAPNYLLSGYSQVGDLFVWDKVARDCYEGNGFQGNIVEVGNMLLYQKLSAGTNKNWDELINKKSSGYTLKIFIALSGAGHNTTEQAHISTISLIAELIKRCPLHLFVVKLHPKDRMEYFQSLRACSNILFTHETELAEQPDALDILFTSDVLISGASTVILDALFLDIPIVSIDPNGELDQFEFLNNKGIIRISSLYEIDKLVLKFKEWEGREVKKKEMNISPSEIIMKTVLEKAQKHA